MRCPNLVVSDKFFCISEGDPSRREGKVRRMYCSGGSYRDCLYFHKDLEARMHELNMSLRAFRAGN